MRAPESWKEWERQPKTTKDSKIESSYVSLDISSTTEDVLGHLGKANIFDLALGATWLALELWCLYISKALCAVLSHPEDNVHFPDVTALREYCDAMGVKNLLELPIGWGKPSHGDPQVFLGLIGLEATKSNSQDCESVYIGDGEMVYMPRHLSSLARFCPAVFHHLVSTYFKMTASQTNNHTPMDPDPDTFAS